MLQLWGMKNFQFSEWPVILLCALIGIAFLLLPVQETDQRLLASFLFLFLTYPLTRKMLKVIYRIYLLNVDEQI